MQIEIINRTGVGRREMFTASPVTFGREADNAVPVSGAHTSRHHGELRFENGRWLLVNLSPNGTEVGGKRVTKKPRVLRDRDVISVGGEVLFEIRLTPTPRSPGDPALPGSGAPGFAPADTPAAHSGTARRTKIWIAIGIYLVLMVGLFVFLSTLKKERSAAADAPELTRSEIVDEIRRPLPPMATDERESHQQLLAARELVNRLDAAPDAMYRAYLAYRRSLLLGDRTEFVEGLDQRRFLDVQERLIERVSRAYAEAYEKYKSRQFREAEEAFRRLMQIYPDPSSRIHENAEKHRAAAAEALVKIRRRRF